jgi:hypothetical protein
MKLVACVLLVSALSAQIDHPAVNADSAIIQDFEKRVAAYVKLRDSVESGSPKLKSTESQARISHYESELGHAIRQARKNAQPGDIFSPEIAGEFRRLTAIAMQPADAEHIKQSLRRAEPVQLHLHINEKYPDGVPLQSSPPSLLANLPPLPKEIEYRITGTDLVLLDTRANLIVDLIRGLFS